MSSVPDKKELQESFEKYLVENGRYPQESIRKDWTIGDCSTITVDIAIVINDIVIQAFKLLDTIGNSETHAETYSQIIDSVTVESKVLYASFNQDNNSWIIKPPILNSSKKAKCFMTFSTAGKQFLDKADKKIQEQKLLPIVSELKDKCSRICCACVIYLFFYILMYLGNCRGLYNCELPLSWEFLSLIAIIIIFTIMPTIVPFIKVVKVGSTQIELAKEVFEEMRMNKV